MKKNNNQIAINIAANLFSFAVTFAINFFFTPFLIKSFGIGIYSFYTMTGNFTSFFQIITNSLNSMAARFLTVEYSKKKYDEASAVYSTVFFSNLGLCVLFSVTFTVIVVLLDSFLKIPAGYVTDVKLLFAFTFLAFIITLFGSVFATSTFCKNRLDIRSGLSISECAIRIGALLLLFSLAGANIMYLGIAVAVYSLTTALANVFISRKLIPEVSISFKSFKRKIVGSLLGAGFWHSLSQSSTLLMTGLDVLMANLFLNEEISGQIGIVKTIPALIYSISSTIVNSYTPQFVISYSEGGTEKLLGNIKSSMKVISVIMSIPLAGFVAYGKQFYTLWLPTENANLLYWLTVVTMIPTFFNVFIGALNNVFLTTKNLRKPAVNILTLGIINIVTVISLLLILPERYGAWVIAGISGLLYVYRYFIFVPTYSAECLNVPKNTFYPSIIRSIFSTALLIVIFSIIANFVKINSWFMFLVVVSISGIIGILLNARTLLSKEKIKAFLGRKK